MSGRRDGPRLPVPGSMPRPRAALSLGLLDAAEPASPGAPRCHRLGLPAPFASECKMWPQKPVQIRRRIRCVNFGRRCVKRFRLQWFDDFHGRVARSGSLMVHLAGDVKTSTYGFAWGSSFRSSFISLGLNIEFTLELAAGRTTFRRTTPTCATSSSISWLILVCRRPSRLLPNSPQMPADACNFARSVSKTSERLV